MSRLIVKICAALTAACAIITYKWFSASKTRKCKVLVENLGNNIPTFNPHNINDLASLRIAYDIYEGLIRYNINGELVLTGATRYEVSDDFKKYTFYLRENAKWTNGDPVTADDYVFSYRRALVLAKFYDSLLYPIKNAKKVKAGDIDPSELGVYADGKFKLVIELEEPNSEFIHYVTLPIFLPTHKKNFENDPIGFSNYRNIVSNGAYKIKKYVMNDKIILEKSEKYWDKDNVKIDEAVFLMITKGTVDLNSFRAGEIDITYYELPAYDAERYIKEFGSMYKIYDVLEQDKLVFNMKNNKLKDIRVRKALSMAIDRNKLNTAILKNSMPSYAIIPENMQNGKYKDDIKGLDSFKWINATDKERCDEARELLKSAGYSTKNKLNIEIYSYTSELNKKVIEAIKDMYESTFDGVVTCDLRFDDWSAFEDNVLKGKFEIIGTSWIADYNLPSNFTMLYTTNNVGNHGFVSEKSYDDLYMEGLRCSGTDCENIQHLLNAVGTNGYYVSPYSIKSHRRLVSDKVIGFNTVNNKLERYITKDLDIVIL